MRGKVAMRSNQDNIQDLLQRDKLKNSSTDIKIERDPFYSDANRMHLEKALAALNRGEGKLHELIEE